MSFRENAKAHFLCDKISIYCVLLYINKKEQL